MSKTIEEALATAEAAGYRIDALLGTSADPNADEMDEPEVESQAVEPEKSQIEQQEPHTEELEPQTVSTMKAADSA
jgi:hypothetical protein